VPPAADGERGERLQKVLARAGVASRRQCEALITAGRVQVNGQVARTLGIRVHPGRDRIQVDGEAVRVEAPVTILLHKPAGYITSRSDPQGRAIVTSLLPEKGLPRLFPVGRLDWDTEGLLLLTNDGELANALTHPRFAVRKVYHAKVSGHPTPEALALLTRGVMSDGEMLRALQVEPHHPTRQNTWIAITLEQGRYRQVRRMCEAIGHPVLKLTRVALGPVTLGTLPRGQWRPLSPAELRRLYAHVPRADASGMKEGFEGRGSGDSPGSATRERRVQKDLDRSGPPGYDALRMGRKR
jgi:23S rRNA pseudouridine2605 synthase